MTKSRCQITARYYVNFDIDLVLVLGILALTKCVSKGYKQIVIA